jgi:hypothetical protein
MGADRAVLPCPGSSVVAKEAGFQNPTGQETIGTDLAVSGDSQAHTGEAEVGKEVSNPDRRK